jgi:lysophospholipase L1-like esterase
VSILRAHPGEVSFITIDVGSNDLLNLCLDQETGRIAAACAQRTMPAVQANLASIIDALRAAAPGVPIAGMSYWDPFLGFWIQGPDGPRVARGDSRAMRIMNAALVDTYQAAGTLVADVAAPTYFDIANFTGSIESRWGPIPINVANACRWTWFCTGPPLGPDPHPNTVGYGIIADAFEAVLPV